MGIQLPTGYCGHIAPRSGLALHHHIDIGGGIMDEDYRGNLGVILYNHSEIPFKVSRGDRIAQFICQKICYPILEEVGVLDLTKRGEGGFGSSGINPLNPELNPICYLLALLAHHFLHVSRISVKSLTLWLLMSYIYGAPILDVSRSHTTTQHSR